MSVPKTFNNLELEGSNFRADLLNNGRTVWPRTTKFGRITDAGEAYF